MKYKRLATNLYIKVDRIFKCVHHKYVLVSWIQRKCQRCQRFLSKRQFKYCSKCKPIMDKQQKSKYDKIRYYSKKIITLSTNCAD